MKSPKHSKLKSLTLSLLRAPGLISFHLFGEEHNHGHRMSVGFVIMIAGVTLSKQFHAYPLLHFACDLAGYMVHGIGAVPFIEFLQANSKHVATITDTDNEEIEIFEIRNGEDDGNETEETSAALENEVEIEEKVLVNEEKIA